MKRALRFPPFAREIMDIRRRGLVPVRPIVVALDSWDWGKTYPRIVIPKDSDPADLDFCAIAGLTVYFVWSPKVSAPERAATVHSALSGFLPAHLTILEIADAKQIIATDRATTAKVLAQDHAA